LGEGEVPGGDGEGEVPPAGLHGGDTSGEGEEGASTPRSAAEYYAQNPVHFLQIAGADLPCCCEQCVAKKHEEPASVPLIARSAPRLSVLSTLDADRPTTTSQVRSVRTVLHDAAAQPQSLRQLSPLARKIVAAVTSPKTRLDQTLDAIAADITDAQTAPVKIALRRPRSRG
jgi:hypothetical protein